MNHAVKIRELADRLANIGPLLPGSISQQLSVCRKVGCKCMDPNSPRLHGPYTKLSYGIGGRQGSVFIKEEDRSAVERMTGNYKVTRGIVTEMALLGVDLLKGEGADALDCTMAPEIAVKHSTARLKASPSATIREIERIRDKWKSKAKELRAELEKNRIKLRDMIASREKWRVESLATRKAIAEAEGKIVRLEKDLENCKKNFMHRGLRLRRPVNQPATPTQ